MESIALQWERNSRRVALEDAVPLTLPSGTTIKARRPGPSFLATFGRLPLSLASAASGSEAAAPAGQDAVEFAVFLRELLVYCVVEPAISLTPKEGEIHPRAIADADLTYIYAWALRGSEAGSLESFRAKRSDGGAGDNGAQSAHAPVRTHGIGGPDARAELRPGRGRRNGAAAKRS